MKTLIRFFAVVLAVNAINSPAQIYNILHNFGGTGHDGSGPFGSLVLGGNTFYGTTVGGGTNGGGTIFKINTDGSGYGTLFGLSNSPVAQSGMVLIGDTLYGTLIGGGTAGSGSIFKINTDGSGYSELYAFSATIPSVFGTNSDGFRPQGDLVTDGTTLYGATEYGGTNGTGTIYKIGTDGLGFTVLKTFSPTFLGTNNVSLSITISSGTNIDGARPISALVLAGNTLYGTTFHGGISNGVVFSMQTDGSDYTVLKYFSPISGNGGLGTNLDGAAPIAGLTLSGETLYGMAVGGGATGAGNIFKLKTNGTAFASLHDFSYADGIFPRNALIIDNATLYGTTAAGGVTNKGTMFMILTNGADFTVLRSFDNVSGFADDAKFVLSSNVLFGTASGGGTNSGGVVFRLTVLPQIMSDTNFGFGAGGFGFDFTGVSNQTAIIESTTNLAQPVWSPLQTNLLIGAPLYFSDAIQQPNAFYRIRSP